MRQVYRFDNEGYYVEPVVLSNEDEMPKDCTDVFPMYGLYKPQFIEGEWREGLSEEEISNILMPKPEPPTGQERIDELENTILQLLMRG